MGQDMLFHNFAQDLAARIRAESATFQRFSHTAISRHPTLEGLQDLPGGVFFRHSVFYSKDCRDVRIA